MQNGPHVTRLKFVVFVFTALWMVLWGRVVVLQGLRHERYLARARDQRIEPVTLRAWRGCIFDRNGEKIADNITAYSYGVRPSEIGDPDRAAGILSAATGLSHGAVRSKLVSDRSFVWLVRQVDHQVAERLDGSGVSGLHKIEECRRYYPLGEIASHLVGYTDIDGRGIEGLELFADDFLAGRNGKSFVFRDARGRAAQSLETPDIAPVDGRDVYLTIDRRIQEVADEEIERCVDDLHAAWGGVIVLDTRTGDVLAMSNAPRFDPNDPRSFDPSVTDASVRRNRLVTDMLEPGSTFKIVTFAEALESGAVKEEDMIDCENGKYRIGRHTINDSHELGEVTVSEAFIHSSNIGAVKLADKIGRENMYRRSRSFGFGTVTGIGAPDESEGDLPHPKRWSGLTLPTLSFGQGVAVSPIQLVMAYAAVANGGDLLRPRIIRRIDGGAGKRAQENDVMTIRRVMRQETAKRIEDLLCGVVESGTGKNAGLPNVRIAGKTGTAQRIRKGGGGYEQGKYVSSFVGYIVDREPRILCLVMVDSPRGLYYGSQVAAPVFRNIVNRILNMGETPLAPVAEKGEKPLIRAIVTVPDCNDEPVGEAVDTLARLGFNAVIVGDTTKVARQLPGPGARLAEGATVTLYSNPVTVMEGNRVRVPELRGKTVRQAMNDLVQAQLEVNVSGSGIVMSQAPSPGTLVRYGTVCRIECRKN